ncbi:hypothetical protein RCH14_000519 [Massilia sp. MP_M2]|uniref:hypothetical protein n=1 Tax=Massilia sp. MP_M2 TaxID=3071713 RepID=UPI00319E6D8F
MAMDALTRTITPPAVPGSNTPGGVVRAGTGATRALAAQPSATAPATGSATAAAARAPRRSAVHGPDLQIDVAQAQQALDYLARIATQLEALKADLSTRLAGRGAASRQLEARARQLGETLDARRSEGGAGLDAELGFDGDRVAQQRFLIDGLDIASLQAAGRQTLGFSVGSVGGPQLAATFEPGMTGEEIARRLDRALAPVGLRAGLDTERALVFTTPEAAFDGVKDAIAVTGRGRVDTVALPATLAPQEWQLGNPDALRQGLREVVQALARVRRSQDAATLALSLATARTAQPELPQAELALLAADFSGTATSHDYQSLLAITSALVGVSRERVQALLGLR